MGIGYQHTDRHCFDYDIWYLPDLRLPIRGPAFELDGGDYISFIGAAQTFGRFSHSTFAHQIGLFFNTPSLNLGYSGAGPEFFLKNPKLLEYINKSKICFIQVMSGRSVSALHFEASPLNNGVLKFVSGKFAGESFLAADAYSRLKKELGEKEWFNQISAVQKSWVENYQKLLGIITCPKIMLWVSQRNPEDELNVRKFLGDFPQFISKDHIKQMLTDEVLFIDCTLTNKRLQPLISRFESKLYPVFDEKNFPNRPNWSRYFNTYYATQNMHNHVSLTVCRNQKVQNYFTS